MCKDLLSNNASSDLPNGGLRHYWKIAALLFVFTVIAFQFDTRVASFNRFGDLPGDVRRILQLSEIFAHGFGVILVAVGIFLLAPHKRRFIPRVAICAIWPGLIVHGTKLLVTRIRPGKIPAEFPTSGSETWMGFWTGPASDLNWVYDTQSFPSAHTATALGLAIGLCWLFPKGRYLFLSLALLAALQRIEAGAHWLSDVLAGATLAVIGAGAVTQNWGLGWVLGWWERRGQATSSTGNSELEESSPAAARLEARSQKAA